jgi:hypothetical protein
MAGSVFSLTLRSTGQAKALTELSERLRTFERTLAADLQNVNRGGSKLILAPHSVYAYWTETQKDLDVSGNDCRYARFAGGGDPERMYWDVDESNPTRKLKPEMPRADMLMLFTSRRGASFQNPAVESNLQMVIYGHAELGEFELDDSTPSIPDDWRWRKAPANYANYYTDAAIQSSPPRAYPLPASEWHLARRAVVVVNRWPPQPFQGAPLDSVLAEFCADRPNDPELFTGEKDILGVNWRLAISGSVRPFDFGTEIATGTSINDINGVPFAENPESANNWLQRCSLDATPPAAMAERMGAYLLPNCASFKVEWTFAPGGTAGDALAAIPDSLWIDPMNYEAITDPANGLIADLREEYLEHSAGLDDLNDLLIDPTRQLTSGQPVLWHAENPSGDAPPGEPDPLFPSALRVTIDVYDDVGRLERPIRHVMVIPVGS